MEQKSAPNGSGFLDDYTALEIPEALRPSVERHKANLSKLVETLRASGISEAVIEASTAAVVESYKTELLDALKAMMRAGDA